MTSVTAMESSVPTTELRITMPQEISTRITGNAARAKFGTRPIRVIVRAASLEGIDPRNGNEIFSNADIAIPPKEGFWSLDRVRNCAFYTFTHTACIIIALAGGFFIMNHE